MKRFNPNPSPLADLSDNQKQQLLTWLELHPVTQVLEKVAAPAPAGFGIKTYPCTLRRFHARHKLATQSDDQQLAVEITKAATTEELHSATTQCLKQIAFELATNPKVGAKQFKILSRWMLRLRDQERDVELLKISRERLALEREKFELNSARLALSKAVELQEILKNDSVDDEDKIRAARDRIFPRASDDPRNANPQNGH